MEHKNIITFFHNNNKEENNMAQKEENFCLTKKETNESNNNIDADKYKRFVQEKEKNTYEKNKYDVTVVVIIKNEEIEKNIVLIKEAHKNNEKIIRASAIIRKKEDSTKSSTNALSFSPNEEINEKKYWIKSLFIHCL